MQAQKPSFFLWPTIAGLLIALLATACGSNAKNFVVRPPDPNRNLKIDLAGEDPSNLIGRFIPKGVSDDELTSTRAMQTRCSQYIKPRISKSNVQHDEVFEENASIGVKASAPQVGDAAGINVNVGSGEVIRIQYTIEKVMDAEISDPAAFDQCCQNAPDQCTDRYIGRFVYGTGQVFESVGNVLELDGGAQQAVNLGLDVKWGQAWQRGTKFNNIYFGFEVTERGGTTANAICATGWSKSVPTSLDGQYFVGAGAKAVNESDARSNARKDASIQVIQYLMGEYLKEETSTTSNLIEGIKKDARVLTAVSEGLAKEVQMRCYSDFAMHDDPEGERGDIKVLAFLPQKARQAATEQLIDSATEGLPADDPRRQQFEALKKKIQGAK